MDALAQGFGASGFNRWQPIVQRSGKDRHHLPVTVICAAQFAAHTFQRRWQNPVLERRAVPERSRLPGQHRHVMPGIVDGPVASNGLGGDRILVPVEGDEAGL